VICTIEKFPSSAGLDSERGLLMLSPFWKFVFVALSLTAFPLHGFAVQPSHSEIPGNNPPGSNPLRSHPLTRSSGYIFAGTVKSVERLAPKGNGVATVQISFHVDEAMQGVHSGQMLAIREWAGLWESGQRYRAGERVLLFLYPPSKLGLTSTVRGPQGRFRIGPDGQVVVDPARIGVPVGHPGIEKRLQGRTSVSPRELVGLLRSAEEE
jgi:hypothetical protein